jgi:HAD superfamily hydrolase (TIGR01450 family)
MSSLHYLFRTKKIVFLDMDGTIYLGDRLIEGAKSFLSALKDKKIQYYYLSNNSSRSKSDYVKKLQRLGISSSTEEIILSTDGVIDFLLKKGIKNVYIVGTQSMKDMFIQAGIRVEADNPRFIILGFDTELTYDKLKTAAILLQKGVEMIATHCDWVCPTPAGPIPDIGSFMALFEKATGKKPVKIFGKPNTEMLDHVINQHEAAPDELVIIGDRIYTDMEMAGRIGCDFILVLSGETRKEQVKSLPNTPTLVVENIGRLVSVSS